MTAERVTQQPAQETLLPPEEKVTILHEQVDALLLAGRAVASQLKQHGDHQSSFYGHFSNQCRTCVVGSEFTLAAEAAEKIIEKMFSQTSSEQE